MKYNQGKSGVIYRAYIEAILLSVPYFLVLFVSKKIVDYNLLLLTGSLSFCVIWGLIFEKKDRYEKSFMRFKFLVRLPSISLCFWIASLFLYILGPSIEFSIFLALISIALAFFAAYQSNQLASEADSYNKCNS